MMGEKICKNISEMNPVDGFTCSECGITIIDFREERVDEKDCTASWYEYEFKYCPNCGAKVQYQRSCKMDNRNLKLVSMQQGVEILGKLLFDKLQPTEKGDKYAVLFKSDCEELCRKAFEKVRNEVKNG